MSTPTTSMEVRLKRFLYTTNEDPVFITGNAYYHNAYSTEKAKVISEILHSDNPKLLLNIVQIVNSENLIPRRDTIMFVLAAAVIITPDYHLKRDIYTTLLNIAKSSKDIFTFLKYYTIQHKTFNSSLNKMIRTYYYKKDPFELALEVTKSNGGHGWTHKDILKLSHGKSSNIRTQTVVTYILHGLSRAKAAVEGNEEAADIITLFSDAVELKRCENEKKVVELMQKIHCDNIKQVPSYLHKSKAVWEALIPQLPIGELIMLLPRLSKCDFLQKNSKIQVKIIEALNTNAVKTSRIHPLEIFIALKNFEKGGRAMDPKLKDHLEKMAKPDEEPDDNSTIQIEAAINKPINCFPIVTALHKAMQASFQNITSTGRRMFIGVEVSKEMDNPCLTNKNITCFEAATMLIMSFLRTERDVTVAVFNSTEISIVSLNKHATFPELQSVLKKARSGLAMLKPVFEWAMNKTKPIDIFINFLQSQSYGTVPRQRRDKNKSLTILDTYRKEMALPHTKLISVFLDSPHVTLADGTLNVLDICGIDKDVPRIIEAFSKGLFY